MVIFAWLVMVLITANTSPALGGDYYSDSHIVKTPATLKKTHLHFFMHDTLSGNNPSAIPIVKTNGTNNNIIPFGTVNVFDDWLTVGPHPSSKIIGNARGMYTSTSRGSDLTVLFSADFAFTSGRFNGSSISVFSRDPVVVDQMEVVVEKEVAVVGGRGKFRMAKGFILLKVTSLNFTNGDSILECHATIFN